MKSLKRPQMVVIAALMFASLSTPSGAADSPLRNSDDLTETPAKETLFIFTNNPAGQLDYLSIGAATDLLRSGNSAVSSPSKSLIAIADGNIKISIPAITPEFIGNSAEGFAGLQLKAELLNVKF